MQFGDMVIPETISKRAPMFGSGAELGRRSDDISKAVLKPMSTGPNKKAPVLARKGALPVKGALEPKPVVGPDQVGKRLSTIAKASPIHLAQLKGNIMHAACGAQKGKGSVSKSAVTCKDCMAKMSVGVGKAYRSYDPEDRRQRRLGAAAAGSGIGGGLLVHSGVKDVKADTKSLRTGVLQARQMSMVESAAKSPYGRAVKKIGAWPADSSVVLRKRPTGKVGLGVTLVAAAGGLMADHHKRRYQ